MSMGFRLSEYISPDGTDELLFVFLQRKGNPHDIVFAPGAGPRLHHAAFASRNPISSSMCAISPPIWASPPISNTGPAGTAPATRCSSICAIPTATASSCSTPTISAWTSRTSRCAGTSPGGQAALAAAGAAAMVRRGEPLRRRRAARAGAQGRPDEPREVHRRRDAVRPSRLEAGCRLLLDQPGARGRGVPDPGVFLDHRGEVGGRVGDDLEPVVGEHLLHVGELRTCTISSCRRAVIAGGRSRGPESRSRRGRARSPAPPP